MKSTLGFLGYLTLFSFLLHRTKAVTPVFTDNSPNTIREGLPPGSPYYTFIATDTTPEHNVTYSLESKALEWFNINSTSGVTTVKKTIDREVMGSVYTYKVFASDGTDTAEKTVFQQVLDINDNFPIFSNLPKTVVISEDVCVGSSVFTVTATDADSSPANVIEFDFGAGNEEGRFEFPNAAEGKIILKKPFDYDNGRKQFQLQIIAKNTLKAPYLNSTAVLTINVRDVDDLGAKFEKNFYEATAVKDSLLGTVVTIVQAKDQDGLNATVEYNIYQETNPGNTYKVNNNTGEITVNGPLTIGTQMLVVTATSTKHPPAFTVVKITVASMINMTYTVHVAEEQSNVIIFNLEPTEKFYNISRGNFSIIPSAQSDLFSIEGKDLKVGPTALDRETQGQYQLNIAVEKDGARKGIVMVTINTLDINDNKPLFQGDLPYNASVREDADVGHSILRVTATDADDGMNGTVKYAITGGDRPDLFSMDNSTGIIKVAGGLDRETTAQYTLTVQAYDGGSPSMTNTTSVIINVKDVNDNLPVFNDASISKTIPEWATNGTEVAVVSATDPDDGDNGKITYVIQEGADGKFVIDPNSGVITTTGGLSYTTKPIYTLTVIAHDNGSPPRSSVAVVQVTIKPRTNTSYTKQIVEGTANVEVLNLMGVNQDYRVSGATFSLTSGNDDNLFYVDAANQVLKVGSRPLDRELRSEYQLQMQVEKDGITRGTAMVTVQVLDINDNSPSFQGSVPYFVSIKENVDTGADVFKVQATDSDSGLNGTVKYAITAGNDQGLFSIDNTTGQISLVAGNLDRESTAQFTLTVQAYDGGSPPMTNTTNVVINVQDVNDNSPVLNQTFFTKALSEWATNGTEVAVVSATDPDDGDNGKITYVIKEGADGKFVIDPNSGVITTTGGLSYTTKPIFTIIVKASDHGSSPRSATAVVSVSVEPKTNKTYSVQVTENTSNEIVMNLLVVEQDYNATGASFSISSGNSDGHFEINVATKDLQVGTNPLDREIKDVYILRVTLVKHGIVRGVATIIVHVLDVNDNSPAFQGSMPHNVDVKEDLSIGKSILKVTATDGDIGANGTVRYAITAGNQEGRFSIDNITGEISLSKSLDRETTAQFTLTVQAYDGGSPPMTNTTTVVINVQDVNDNSPVYKSRVTNVTIPETTTVGTQIARLMADDSDIAENSRILYTIVDGDDGKFVINRTTGSIKTSGELSFKERPEYTLIIDAKDNGSSPRSESAIVYITITNAGVNQYAPVFTKNEYLGGVYKDTSDDQLVLTVSATDADSGVNGEVMYELTKNPAPYFFYLETVSGRLRSANSFVDKEGELYILKAVAKDKASQPKTSTSVNLCVFVLRYSHSVVITADVTQDFILKNIDEFRSVLDDLTGGKAFIKSIRPKEGNQESSEIVVNVVKNKTEMTVAQIEDAMKQKQDDIDNKYSKWKIRTYEPPKTGQQVSSGGLSAIVIAMVCLALLIGVGGIIMIIILIKKRREKERIRKNARVTFSDEPHYINIDGNLPVSRLREVDSAQEAHEGYTNVGDETSSVGSEDVQTTPNVMNYFNDAYHNDEHIEHDQKDGFVNNIDTTNFKTFFPPPPSEPPPPVPDSDDNSLTSEESINSEENEPYHDHIAVPPPHDFADSPSQQVTQEPIVDSPTHSHTDSTSRLISPDSYKHALLNDLDSGFGALRKSSNPELTTEL